MFGLTIWSGSPAFAAAGGRGSDCSPKGSGHPPMSRDEVGARHLSALADLASLVLTASDGGEVAKAAVAVLQALLETETVLILRQLSGQSDYSLEVGADADRWLPPGTIIPREWYPQADAAGRSLSSDSVSDLACDAESTPLPNPVERPPVSGVVATIPGEIEPWGLLAAYSGSRTPLADDAREFVRAVANHVGSAMTYSSTRQTLANIINESPDPCARFGPDLQVEYTNAAMVEATGIPAQTFRGHTFRE